MRISVQRLSGAVALRCYELSVSQHSAPGPGRPPAVRLSGPPAAELATAAAKAWLVALIRWSPLSTAHLVPLGALASEGPDLCGAILDALESDAALEWLTATPDGLRLALRSLGPADGDDPASIVESVECLRGGVLAALLDSGLSEPGLLASAGDRLAHVCALLASASVAQFASGAGRSEETVDPLGELAARAEGRGGAATASPDLSTVDPAARPQPLWIAALDRQIAEAGRSGTRFALLLVDVDGADRLRAAMPSGDALTTIGRSIRQLVRRGDLLAHEDDGRIWVIAPGSGRAGGVALASRLADAVRRSGELRGAPLTASVGLAVYPEEGLDAASLADHAEEQMYAARASGTSMTGGDPDEPFGGGL